MKFRIVFFLSFLVTTLFEFLFISLARALLYIQPYEIYGGETLVEPENLFAHLSG